MSSFYSETNSGEDEEFDDASEGDWGDAEEIQDSDIIKCKEHISQNKKCWLCPNCNIHLLVESTINNYNGYCFRCQIMKFKPKQTKIILIKNWISPTDLHWKCFECKNLNTNIRSNYCIFDECRGRNICFIANDIEYKPSLHEFINDKSRISNIAFNGNQYSLYHRLCKECGSRCHNIQCLNCKSIKTKIVETIHAPLMICGYIHQYSKAFPWMIMQIINAYFTGQKVESFIICH